MEADVFRSRNHQLPDRTFPSLWYVKTGRFSDSANTPIS
jgi:hypothetical protein